MDGRWFGLCMASACCFSVATFAAVGGAAWLVVPFTLAGLWYGWKALKADPLR